MRALVLLVLVAAAATADEFPIINPPLPSIELLVGAQDGLVNVQTGDGTVTVTRRAGAVLQYLIKAPVVFDEQATPGAYYYRARFFEVDAAGQQIADLGTTEFDSTGIGLTGVPTETRYVRSDIVTVPANTVDETHFYRVAVDLMLTVPLPGWSELSSYDRQLQADIVIAAETPPPSAAPTLGDLMGIPIAPVPVGTRIAASVGFTDATVTASTYAVVWDWGTAAIAATAQAVPSAASGTIAATAKYDQPGVYIVTLTVTDGDADPVVRTATVVVFDSDVSGKADIARLGATGTFNFSVGFQNGGIKGRVRYDEKGKGGVSFDADRIDAITISDGGKTAVVTGVGGVNKASGQAFTLTVHDGGDSGLNDTIRLSVPAAGFDTGVQPIDRSRKGDLVVTYVAGAAN